ncbi:hypothetical protein M0811_00903 [Anaeramoeba ignava]|uniref:PAS domain-containing protein n=1 Tax=Anaeramoeba ignava TaxID=1746090 RepID=A0A9Q0RBN3_ANAIG|nr:hypothetical protein M0811_00903 [Anaeramoeba ignava]
MGNSLKITPKIFRTNCDSLQKSKEAFIALDINGKIIESNQSFVNILGITENPNNRFFSDFCPFYQTHFNMFTGQLLVFFFLSLEEKTNSTKKPSWTNVFIQMKTQSNDIFWVELILTVYFLSNEPIFKAMVSPKKYDETPSYTNEKSIDFQLDTTTTYDVLTESHDFSIFETYSDIGTEDIQDKLHFGFQDDLRSEEMFFEINNEEITQIGKNFLGKLSEMKEITPLIFDLQKDQNQFISKIEKIQKHFNDFWSQKEQEIQQKIKDIEEMEKNHREKKKELNHILLTQSELIKTTIESREKFSKENKQLYQALTQIISRIEKDQQKGDILQLISEFQHEFK